jgi:hypothetical protein
MSYNFSTTKVLLIFAVVIIFTISISTHISGIEAITNFYIALPDVIQDLRGITFTIETTGDEIYKYASWTNNGSSFIPDNNTQPAQPNNNKLHLDNNNFLISIADDLPVGTRLSMCVAIPYPIEQQACQWDAIDNDKTSFAEFDFFFQS